MLETLGLVKVTVSSSSTYPIKYLQYAGASGPVDQ